MGHYPEFSPVENALEKDFAQGGSGLLETDAELS